MTLAVLLAASFAAPAAPALAEDDADEGEAVEIEATALYASPVTEAIPDTLTSEVPPTALCVLEPTLCPEESNEVRSVLRDTIETTLGEVPAEPVHPIPPDTIAVSYLAGNTRYQSAILVEVPEPPANHGYQQVELVLPQTDPSYHVDSPAFREVILGTFSAIGASDPDLLAEGVNDALTEEDLISTEQLLGIELCPLTAEFEPGGAPMAYPEEELPRDQPEGGDEAEEDELGEVAVDCLRGADGIYDEDAQEWRFDLTFAAQAWADGDLDNHGLLLSPSGAPNLAFGDPDSSTNAQVVLDVTAAALVVETMDMTPPDPPEDAGEGPGTEGPPAGGDGTTGGGTGSAPSSGGSSSSGGAPPPSGGGGGGGPAGSSGGIGGASGDDGPPMDEGVVASSPGGAAEETQAMPAADTGVQRPWWVWLLVPVILGSAYLTHRSLLGGTTGTKQPSGALARLSATGRPARG